MPSNNILHSETLRDLSNRDDAPPGIAALFLIEFDIRKGYSITWKRSVPDLQLDNLVEFKSLPSGLHNVREDLIYFVHEEYAGQSAFLKLPDDSEHRNARMLAVGVLVPLRRGRLGKAWMHAPALKDLVSKVGEDLSQVRCLEDYWEAHALPKQTTETAPESPIDVYFSHNNRFAASRRSGDVAGVPAPAPPITPAKTLAPLHPALSLSEFLDQFGPLVFPLYRQALLRKRVLFVGDPPVHSACDYVYDLSLLSTLPDTLLPLLPRSAEPRLRPRPLFCIGVHDLPYLDELSAKHASRPTPETEWIANTSDKVLTLKPELYDVTVDLPPEYTKNAPAGKEYPKIRRSPNHQYGNESRPGTREGSLVRATQRDARRFVNLHRDLNRYHRFSRLESTGSTTNDIRLRDTTNTNATASTADALTVPLCSAPEVVEPMSWTALAYSSFMWWASAGERGGWYESEEEEEIDARMLFAAAESQTQTLTSTQPQSHDMNYGTSSNDDNNSNNNTPPPPANGEARRRRHSPGYARPHAPQPQPREITLIAYFRGLTVRMFTVLADAVARRDEGSGSLGSGGGVEEGAGGGGGAYPGHSVAGSTVNTESSDDGGQATPASEEDGDGDGEEGDERPLLSSSRAQTQTQEEPVVITYTDVTDMGLDPASASDRAFVVELLEVWWGWKGVVKSDGIKCCGIRIL